MSRPEVVSKIAHDSCVTAPRVMPRGDWWRELDEDFATQPEGFDLGLWDKLKVQSTAALDILIRTGGATALATLAGPLGFNPRALRQSFADRPFYENMALSGDASLFFRKPRERVPVRVRRSRRPGFKPRGGVCESLRFKSPFEPANPGLRKSYLRHVRNRFAHVRYWRHNDGPRPTIVAIHGFGAEGYALNEWMFALPWFYHELGIDVALFNLPFHGRRQTRFSPFSGHGFFAGGVSRINEAFAQAVYDFRLLVRYLRENRGVDDIGVTGISLGGYVTALLAATEPTLRFAIPNVPVVSLADLVLEWEPLATIMRRVLKSAGKDLSEARRLLAVSSPLTYAPVLPTERLMVIGGVGDRLAPPKHSRLLWDHWDWCRLHWFPGSHVLHLDRNAYLGEVARFLRDIRFTS